MYGLTYNIQFSLVQDIKLNLIFYSERERI